VSRAKQSVSRLVDQRARRRATQALIEMHRDEFRDLYQWHRMQAVTEARTIAEAATQKQSFHPSSEPPRLMPGRRLPGQEVVDRIDVARCPHCIKHHDRGHVCAKCGARPTTVQAPVSALSLARQRPAGLRVGGTA